MSSRRLTWPVWESTSRRLDLPLSPVLSYRVSPSSTSPWVNAPGSCGRVERTCTFSRSGTSGVIADAAAAVCEEGSGSGCGEERKYQRAARTMTVMSTKMIAQRGMLRAASTLWGWL